VQACAHANRLCEFSQGDQRSAETSSLAPIWIKSIFFTYPVPQRRSPRPSGRGTAAAREQRRCVRFTDAFSRLLPAAPRLAPAGQLRAVGFLYAFLSVNARSIPCGIRLTRCASSSVSAHPPLFPSTPWPASCSFLRRAEQRGFRGFPRELSLQTLITAAGGGLPCQS
jgi:hypothetical protein